MTRHLSHLAPVLSLSAVLCAPAPATRNTNQGATVADGTSTPLILGADQGERRIRRVMGGALAIVKVDQRNGGSPNLVMGYEAIPPGNTIAAHRHGHADEIIFVHRGSGSAELGDKRADVATGATIYIPRDTRVMLKNTGTEPLVIAFFFSAPGYEEYLRDTSVPEGTAATPLTPAELTEIRARHRQHIMFDPQ